MYPCLGKGYPDVSGIINGVIPVQDGDLGIIAQPIDFIGINYYFETPVAYDESGPMKFAGRNPWQECSSLGWPSTPAGLERQLLWIAEISKGAFGKTEIPIYITENGCACDDMVTADGRIHDTDRIRYLQNHLAVCADLIKKGVPLRGYYVWSLMDNFEWAFGYTKRFGIIHIDFKTLKRTLKDSAFFLRDVIAGYGEW